MRIAISTWQGRISPVFDVAGTVLLVDIDSDREVGRESRGLPEGGSFERARQVAALGAEVLICGAISCGLERSLRSAGVRVIGQVCGPVEEVLDAFVSGRLTKGAYRMPGCCRRRRYQGGRGMGMY